MIGLFWQGMFLGLIIGGFLVWKHKVFPELYRGLCESWSTWRARRKGEKKDGN